MKRHERKRKSQSPERTPKRHRSERGPRRQISLNKPDLSNAIPLHEIVHCDNPCVSNEDTSKEVIDLVSSDDDNISIISSHRAPNTSEYQTSTTSIPSQDSSPNNFPPRRLPRQPGVHRGLRISGENSTFAESSSESDQPGGHLVINPSSGNQYSPEPSQNFYQQATRPREYHVPILHHGPKSGGDMYQSISDDETHSSIVESGSPVRDEYGDNMERSNSSHAIRESPEIFFQQMHTLPVHDGPISYHGPTSGEDIHRATPDNTNHSSNQFPSEPMNSSVLPHPRGRVTHSTRPSRIFDNQCCYSLSASHDSSNSTSDSSDSPEMIRVIEPSAHEQHLMHDASGSEIHRSTPDRETQSTLPENGSYVRDHPEEVGSPSTSVEYLGSSMQSPENPGSCPSRVIRMRSRRDNHSTPGCSAPINSQQNQDNSSREIYPIVQSSPNGRQNLADIRDPTTRTYHRVHRCPPLHRIVSLPNADHSDPDYPGNSFNHPSDYSAPDGNGGSGRNQNPGSTSASYIPLTLGNNEDDPYAGNASSNSRGMNRSRQLATDNSQNNIHHRTEVPDYVRAQVNAYPQAQAIPIGMNPHVIPTALTQMPAQMTTLWRQQQREQEVRRSYYRGWLDHIHTHQMIPIMQLPSVQIMPAPSPPGTPPNFQFPPVAPSLDIHTFHLDQDQVESPEAEQHRLRLASQLLARASVFHKYKKTESAEKCSICLTEYEEGDCVRRPPCLHMYHKHCLDRWMEMKPTCPLCQTSFAALLDNQDKLLDDHDKDVVEID